MTQKCHGADETPDVCFSTSASVKSTSWPQSVHTDPGFRALGARYAEQVSHQGTAYSAPADGQNGDVVGNHAVGEVARLL